ncbi:RelB antitoxin [Balnearium lithotrophicum]|uniref:RelB antitoxin n=1 Tax=Balnearium lithotrophicum TaxID=223788 RepID=A0A521CKG1_9BACT|nr:type II toxin-antitoxin system RelB/DinJ family antitoxin [Balnearium lithotrophicum]SMO59885.1 RelB antitoxin [Balnearium lithotrophicum]
MEKEKIEMEKFIKLLSNRTKNLNFRVNPKLKKLFEETCQKEGLTVSDCLNYLMLKYIQEKNGIKD